MLPGSSPMKRFAACSALSKVKLEVRNSASLCSWNWLCTLPARTASVSGWYESVMLFVLAAVHADTAANKKPGKLGANQRLGCRLLTAKSIGYAELNRVSHA
jgi:hypothetical protein